MPAYKPDHVSLVVVLLKSRLASCLFDPPSPPFLPSFGRPVSLDILLSARLRSMFSMDALMAKRLSVVHSDPEILGGTPVFVGTLVPLRNLFNYLERGYGLDEFLEAFPSVSKEQALAILENAHEVLTADARAARSTTAASSRQGNRRARCQHGSAARVGRASEQRVTSCCCGRRF